ncbi:toll-like receptor 13 isoform X1 [Kryptolebias marmoratus]|uniref:toll-like receptor 13 isoform X1 n=1 Tax=Kryptolebias marmoratus TaxID=37003 RepID=UPI000D5307F4|nr:toll-like receptor 13 isoform X1 [Kryptolebias marmoratus]
MESEEDRSISKGGMQCSKLSFIFFFLFVTCFVPVNGFFLKSCRISKNAALCVTTFSKLKTVPQDIPPTVTGLDLSQNHILKIQPSDFPHLPDLNWLNFHQNQISQIDSFAFASLISLQKLTLNNNNLVKLVENVFGGLGNLTELRLNTNYIKKVSSTSFQSLTKLKVLDISYNKLQTITNLRLILQHLPQLQELAVKGNGFKSFQSKELTNHTLSLRALDFFSNPFRDFRLTEDIFPSLTRFTIGDPFSNKVMKWDVSNKTFLSGVSSLDISSLYMALDDKKALLEAVNASLTSLTLNRMKRMKYTLTTLINSSCSIPTMSSLQIRHNRLQFIYLSTFKLCVYVTTLDLAENYLETIPENVFAPMERLKVLTLSYNRFKKVPPAIGNMPNLSKLDLSANKITAVDCQEFSNQTKLIELNMHNNSIQTLKPCVFKDLVQLQILRLQYNAITDLDGAFKKPLPNLKHLYLNGNKLTSIKNEVFRGLRSLLNLSLHENQIKELYSDSFVGLRNLTEIQLMSNQITKQNLDTGAFNALVNLKRLDLAINHIKYTDSEALSQTPFFNLSHLEELSIATQHYREKSHLPCNFLKGLTNLLRFSARNTQIVYLDKDMFKYSPKLEKLDISSNDLGTLSPQLFSPIQNLKSLYISRTTLQSLDFLIDANLTNLQFLQARKNQYSVITEDVIQSLPSLGYVDFQGNSFMCDCDNAWFLNWTISSAQTQVFDAYNFVCNYPEDFKGTKLLDFNLTSCSVEIGFICFVSTTCMILCFMVMSFTYHFMRWQLYCAYYLFLAWLFDKKHQNKQAPHQYDAFISYNTHDEPWVIGELLPKLEGEQGWRLCLHHRDFEPGKPIVENITDAIYGSRKTICVVSHRYLKSEWCSREVQTASFRLFDEQKDVLILVFLEDIPTYLLSPYFRMRKLLKKQTYLSWPRAAEHPEVFWEKLRQALQTGDDLKEENACLNVLQTP